MQTIKDLKIAEEVLKGIVRQYKMPIDIGKYDLSKENKNGQTGLFNEMFKYQKDSVGEFWEEYYLKTGQKPKLPRWCRDESMLS